MDSKSKKQFKKSVLGIFLMGGLLVVSFQNCSQPFAIKFRDKETLDTPSLVPPPSGGPPTQVVQMGSNKLSVVVGGENTPINIQYVIDDSGTMTNSQKNLADVVNVMNANLNKIAANNFIMSTTSSPGIFDRYFDNLYQNEISKPVFKDLAAEKTEIRRQMSWNVHGDRSQVSFSNLKDRLISMGTNGSDDEVGLAKINSLFSTGQATSLYQPGDKVVFIVLSDEDDVSEKDKRLWLQFNFFGIYKNSYITTERYQSVDGYGVGLTVSYTYKKDGLPYTTEESLVDVLSPYFVNTQQSLIKEGLACEKTDKVSNDLSSYLKYTNAENIVIKDCRVLPVKLLIQGQKSDENQYFREINGFIDFLTAYQNVLRIIPVPVNETYKAKYKHNKGTSFTSINNPYFPGGYFFDNKNEPVNSDVKHVRLTGVDTNLIADAAKTMSGYPERDQLSAVLGIKYETDPKKFLRSALIHRLNQVLGKDSYHFLFFVMDESCRSSLKAGQSVGQQWIDLASEMGPDNATLKPLCRFQDFTDVFSALADKTKKIATRSIRLPNINGNQIKALKQILLNRNSQKQIIDNASYQFVPSTNSINFLKDGVIDVGDQLEIEFETN